MLLVALGVRQTDWLRTYLHVRITHSTEAFLVVVMLLFSIFRLLKSKQNDLCGGHEFASVCDWASESKQLDRFSENMNMKLTWKLLDSSDFQAHWSIIKPTLHKSVHGLFHVPHKPFQRYFVEILYLRLSSNVAREFQFLCIFFNDNTLFMSL